MVVKGPSAGAVTDPEVGGYRLRIADHELLRTVGKGSYGEVWLAKNVIGTFRAVKVVHRDSFADARPFEREFAGLKRFEPISRSHTGWVSILQVGREEAGRYFYYVMEAADDVVRGRSIQPANYSPRTLGSELAKRGRLPLDECLPLVMSLLDALGQLHTCGLIHRDVKPSNIIFIENVPKLADIGLVTTIGEAKSFVGTEGYVPPEGASCPAADLYSLGKVLYQVCMGRDATDFPELPTDLDRTKDRVRLLKLNDVILDACHLNPRKRFQSAQAMFERLARLLPEGGQWEGQVTHQAPGQARPALLNSVAIVCNPELQVETQLGQWLAQELSGHGYRVLPEQPKTTGVQWAAETEGRIREAEAAIVLLSAGALESEMVACEVEIAWDAWRRVGKPQLLPVRLRFRGTIPGGLGHAINSVPGFVWDGPEDNQRLFSELLRALNSPPEQAPSVPSTPLEQEGGAVPLDSRFYLVRPADHEFRSAIHRRDSIVLVQGARQMGKTSLLARGLQQARSQGVHDVHTDLQELNTSAFDSLESFYLAVGECLAERLGLAVLPGDVWQSRSSPNMNFDRYLRREVLEKIEFPLVWGLDEVDRLFACSFGAEVFGIFRSWHNKRALDPKGPWTRLTLAIAYATEAHLFISDLNHSPFNVGTRLNLDDFDSGQVFDLNRRYGSPLQSEFELARFMQLLNGQPFLVRRGLNQLASQRMTFEAFEAEANRDQGIFGDHLRRILLALGKDKTLVEVVRRVLRGEEGVDPESFYRLRSAGVLAGESENAARLRCQLYAQFLKRHLL